MKLITNKSKNLLYCISVEGNVTVQFGTSYAVATQRTADSVSVNTFKIQGWDGTKYTGLAGANIAIGKLTTTFTTPSTTGFKLIRFGLNGASIDTLCRCEMDLKPSTTYTFTCNFTNITQGSISWKDMMLVEGSTVGDYEPYSYNLLDKWKFESSLTNRGITFTNNGDGTFTANGTVSSNIGSATLSVQSGLNVIAGHKYLVDVGNTDNVCIQLYTEQDNIFESYDIGIVPQIITCKTTNNSVYYQIIYYDGTVVNNAVLIPQLYDLTLMYGAGNEPTTVDQFYTDHPELKVSPLGFIGLKNLEISNKNIKRLKYATTTRNLFDVNKFGTDTSSSISIDGNTLLNTIPSGDTGDTFAFTCSVSVKKNTNYIISIQDHSYDIFSCYVYSDILWGNIVKFGVFPLTFNSGENERLVIGFYSIGSRRQSGVATWIQGPQIEEGSTATSYVPYGYLDLGIIPSNSGYILDKYNNLSEELLEENIEKPTGSWNNSLNMLDKSKYPASKTADGVTFTNNGDGSITADGVYSGSNAYGAAFELFKNITINKDHRYLLKGCPSGGSAKTYFLTCEVGAHDTGNGTIFTGTYSVLTPTIRILSANNLTFYPQLYDLTAIYGAGNEPTTVPQFYKDYPGLKTTANYHIPDKTNILLNKIEGKTNKIVQLIDKTVFVTSGTKVGLTFTCDRNTGAVTVNGTSTASSFWNPSSGLPLINNHKYLVCGNYVGSGLNLGLLNQGGGGYDSGNGGIVTAVTSAESLRNTWGITWDSGTTFSNVTIYPQIFDLTAMYGFGKEPTTVEQFKKDYPQFFDSKLDGIWNVRTSGISSTGKNLFDISKWITSRYDVANGTLVERLPNGAICQGTNGTGNGDGRYSNGWFRPMNGQYPDSTYLQAGTYTLSADYTMIENSVVNTAGVNCYLYGDHNYNDANITSVTVGNTVRIKNTYTVEEGYYYPIFTLCSGKAKIKNIQIELNSSATTYEPYIENKIDLLSTQTLNGINGVNDYIEVIDKGNGLYDLKKTQNIASVDMGSLGFDADGNNFVTGAISSDIKTPVNNNTVGNYICQKYVNCALDKSFVNGDFGVNSSGYLYFRDSAYTTVSDFQTAVTGTMFYYQLKTPVVTTIATNLTYNQVSAIRTNGGLLLVNDNNNQKYVQPDITLKENYQYKS